MTPRPPARRAVALGTTLVATLALAPGTATAAPAATPGGAAGAGTAVAVPERYLTQAIGWAPCFVEEDLEFLPEGAERLECGTYTTPRDWDAPDAGGDLVIAVSRLRADDEDQDGSGRSLLVNPGGPGGPGQYFPLYFLEGGAERLTAERDIIGFDPRGTGASTNVTCAGASGLGRELDPRDRSEANTDLILDSAEITARYCQATDADLSPVITTEQTVQDLDLLRALLGEETVDWLGYSAGTWIGAAYATYFPDRVGRFVLDGNVEFTADWQDTFLRDGASFERRFTVDFLPWVAVHEERFGLGATPEEVRAVYEDLRARLAAEPLDLGGGFFVGPALLDILIVGSMYDKDAFTDLADTLAALAALASGEVAVDDGSVEEQRVLAHVARAAVTAPPGQRSLDSFDATFYHTICNDSPWEGEREFLLQVSAEQGAAYPLIGPYQLYQPCNFWNLTERTVLAPRTGAGVPPVLMVNNERDPATPIEGAVQARAFFAGARLVTVEEEGDHTIYPGNECVDERVEGFLLDGEEAADGTCQGEGLPEPAPLDAAEGSADDSDGSDDDSDDGSGRAAGAPVQRALWYAEVAGR